MKRIFSIAIFIGLLAYCFPLFAATIRVPADYFTIQAAIDAAVNGNIVTVADGKRQDISGSLPGCGRYKREEIQPVKRPQCAMLV